MTSGVTEVCRYTLWQRFGRDSKLGILKMAKL